MTCSAIVNSFDKDIVCLEKSHVTQIQGKNNGEIKESSIISESNLSAQRHTINNDTIRLEPTLSNFSTAYAPSVK